MSIQRPGVYVPFVQTRMYRFTLVVRTAPEAFVCAVVRLLCGSGADTGGRRDLRGDRVFSFTTPHEIGILVAPARQKWTCYCAHPQAEAGGFPENQFGAALRWRMGNLKIVREVRKCWLRDYCIA